MEAPKDMLHRYLQTQRDAVLWKLEGLGERDLRWPTTPTGTNLLGLAKHLGSIEFGYFGEVFGRTAPEPMPWTDDDAEDNADMWATADESPADIAAFYRRAWAFADETIAARDLDAPGSVPWWGSRGDVTLHLVLVHVIAETARHAGHADVVRETLDGSAGLRHGTTNLPARDSLWWADYRARLERTATEAGEHSRTPDAAPKP